MNAADLIPVTAVLATTTGCTLARLGRRHRAWLRTERAAHAVHDAHVTAELDAILRERRAERADAAERLAPALLRGAA